MVCDESACPASRRAMRATAALAALVAQFASSHTHAPHGARARIGRRTAGELTSDRAPSAYPLEGGGGAYEREEASCADLPNGGRAEHARERRCGLC